MARSPVDVFLAKAPQPQRGTLTALAKVIRAALPAATEGISYGLPCFLLDGKGVAGFAWFKDHCSYFPMSGSVLGTLAKDVAAYEASKGGLRFPVDKALPAGLVKKLIKARLAELSAPPSKGTGPARAYYDTGVLASKGAYKAGKMHGAWEFFRKDGSVMRSGRFNLGEQTGTWRTYDKNGRLVKETTF